MPRDDIYDHLAQVYLGKRNRSDEKKKKDFNAWLLINIVITFIIFASAFYGLTAYLQQHSSDFSEKVIYSLHNGPAQVPFNFESSLPPTKTFSLTVPPMDASKYGRLNFRIRGREEGSPGVVKVVVRNRRNETSYHYLKDVRLDWRDFSIPLAEFDEISDWSSVTDISFVLESWNVDKKKGIILIDGVCFAS